MNKPARVWIVDDDEAIRFVLERALSRAGHKVELFTSVAAVCAALEIATPNVIVTDIHLPDDDGLLVIDNLLRLKKNVPVIAITGHSDLDQAVAAFKHGVFDYIPKPFDLDQVLQVVARAAAGSDGLETSSDVVPKNRLLGDSAPMQEVFRTVGRLSRSSVSVLITGETGTGKDLVARALHEHSPRSAGPFVAINTAAVPAELLESELFGHERGAFTGAHERRAGRFEEAASGTLFLDEIGDMPLSLQTRLLRVLAEGDYYRVGGRDMLSADVRIIAATHQDLPAKIRNGGFREDLYHRLNVINITLPPLRDRVEDIPVLAQHFLNQAAKDIGLEEKRLRPETLELMKAMPWSGNVRQLQNLCQHVCVMAPGEQVYPEDINIEVDTRYQNGHNGSWSEKLRQWTRSALVDGRSDLMAEVREQLEEVMLECALEHTNGRKIEAAKLLGVGRNTLTRKLKGREETAEL
ncbi:MAG: two-component system nitrogen regulation response regulator GlnG [Lysobacterales bacterium]|jgi:two-component system nitrogen regulation response regulator GlnG